MGTTAASRAEAKAPRRHFQRARHGDEKSRRREAILAAADRHLREAGFDAFAMGTLAREAGIAKGTLYLYFETREEVLLSLYATQLERWCADVTAATRAGMGDAAFVAAILEASVADPVFLDLGGRLGNVLERNVSMERLVESKRHMRAALLPLAAHFEACLDLAPGDGARALTGLTALMLGAAQLEAGPSLDHDDVPADVREMGAMFACRSVFVDAARSLLAGIRGGQARS